MQESIVKRERKGLKETFVRVQEHLLRSRYYREKL